MYAALKTSITYSEIRIWNIDNGMVIRARRPQNITITTTENQKSPLGLSTRRRIIIVVDVLLFYLLPTLPVSCANVKRALPYRISD